MRCGKPHWRNKSTLCEIKYLFLAMTKKEVNQEKINQL